MNRRARSLSALALFPILSAAAPSPSFTRQAEAPQLSISPSFQLKFNGSHNYLLATLVIINASGLEMRNLTVTQVFPDGFAPAAAPDGIHELLTRPEGFAESLQGSTYTMTVPVLHRRELTTGFVVLNYKGRPSDADVAPAEVSYSAGGEDHREKGPPVKLDLSKYSKYSGSLSEYLKRYAGIQIRIPDSTTGDWGFSSLAAKARARSPLGMIEVDGDASEGRFSLLAGAPGDLREVLMSWRPKEKAKAASSPEEVHKILSDQIAAGADFTIELEGAAPEKGAFARGDAWSVATRWKDRVPARLGEGPLKWYVYTDPQKGTQYVVMLRAQGRGAGAGKADVGNPEKEAALMKELDDIARSFRPM
ncbi:MAG: hypothetical protein HY049_16385 [Acidobacteria bacterium]|nr:hypothetical protein [Acidobacteriota bacterium]